MKQIWSPWRMKYFTVREKGCLFCRLQKQNDDESLVIRRGLTCFAVLNRYPYTSGHLMVAPFSHCATLEDLTPAERAEMMELTATAMQVLRKVYRPEGFNVGANIGKAAGAGVAGHVHMHIVPRWGGDANFMTTLADTRILPEDLAVTRQRLADQWPDGTAG